VFVAVGLGVLAGVVAAAGAVAVSVAGFTLSFDAIRAVGQGAHMRHDWAWLLPVSVDGAMAVATVAAVVLHRLTGKTAWYPWAVVLAGAAISVACNGLHATGVLNAKGEPQLDLHPEVRFAVSAIPAVMLTLSVHLLVVLIDVAARKVERGGMAAGTETGTARHDGTRHGTARHGGTDAARVPAQGGMARGTATALAEVGRHEGGTDGGTARHDNVPVSDMDAVSRHGTEGGTARRHGSGTDGGAAARTAARGTEAAARDEARETYRLSLAAGSPLSGRELGQMFDHGERWGRAQIGAVKAEMVTESEGEVA
jgi:hypothetical protein